MSWQVFAEAAPDLAAFGLEKLNRQICYLALLNEAGAPRIHPITPFIGNGMLFMFTEPTSPKIRDLRRDDRYAIHSAVTRDGPMVGYNITGKAELITDPTRRAQAVQIASSPVVNDTYSLFEFHTGHVLVVTYDEEKKKIIRRWQRDEAS
jgi:hypothetical protein